MAGKFTALLMAALIAVPFCCCLGDNAPEAPAPEAHACCHKAAQDASTDVPESSELCDCRDDSRDQWVLAGETKPAPPQWMLLVEISREHLPEMAASAGIGSRRAIDIPEAVRPPGKVLSQVHCRYLL